MFNLKFFHYYLNHITRIYNHRSFFVFIREPEKRRVFLKIRKHPIFLFLLQFLLQLYRSLTHLSNRSLLNRHLLLRPPNCMNGMTPPFAILRTVCGEYWSSLATSSTVRKFLPLSLIQLIYHNILRLSIEELKIIYIFIPP